MRALRGWCELIPELGDYSKLFRIGQSPERFALAQQPQGIRSTGCRVAQGQGPIRRRVPRPGSARRRGSPGSTPRPPPSRAAGRWAGIEEPERPSPAHDVSGAMGGAGHRACGFPDACGPWCYGRRAVRPRPAQPPQRSPADRSCSKVPASDIRRRTARERPANLLAAKRPARPDSLSKRRTNPQSQPGPCLRPEVDLRYALSSSHARHTADGHASVLRLGGNQR